MSQVSLAALGESSFLHEGGGKYGTVYLDAVTEAVTTWEMFGVARRDQGGHKTQAVPYGPLLERIVYEVFRRIQGQAPDWPLGAMPIPEETPLDGTDRAKQMRAILHDFLYDCQWSRLCGIDTALADKRSYVRIGAITRAVARIEGLVSLRMDEPSAPLDRELAELRIRVEALLRSLEDARSKGFNPVLQEDEPAEATA